MSTSPSRLHGDDFRFRNVSINFSWLVITPSLAMIVSFFAASVFSRASFSARRDPLNSVSRELARFSVSSRSFNNPFPRSSNSTSRRDAESSSTAALHASMDRRLPAGESG